MLENNHSYCSFIAVTNAYTTPFIYLTNLSFAATAKINRRSLSVVRLIDSDIQNQKIAEFLFYDFSE